ncbi:LysR family transcriptional regulator [Paraburkholderia sp. 32]|uniref:LysR family transcriptional regulator n=1 Tax=unclassified Paraburkholderia TaxID=2615204 RepID=UPI003D2092C0
MELHEMDMNLLVVFNRLLAERSVSRTAESLGLTQPSISNSLAKLRRLFDDDLFLRTPRGMEPTPFAEKLGESLPYAMGMIHSALNQQISFDPMTSTRAFTIGMTDIGEMYFLPRLMDELAKAAPGVTVTTVINTAANLKDEMEMGHVDLAIGLLPQLKAGFFQRRLFRQRYACMFRKGHRLDKRRINLEEFTGAEHVVVVAAGTGHGEVDRVLERSGIQRKIRLTVQHYIAVGPILSSTEMIATVPERFAQRFAGPFGLSHVAHPALLPEIAINLFWHAKFHREAANQWLRSLLFELFSC